MPYHGRNKTKGDNMTVQDMIDAGMVEVTQCPPGRAKGVPRAQMRVKPHGGAQAKRAANYALSMRRHARKARLAGKN